MVVLQHLQDKILQSTGRGQNIMVTNDGATILKSLYVDNPAAKVLVGEALCVFHQANRRTSVS
jgi:chaperonin GroEL (HSP60 family)